jgi:hypothetical protein
MARGLVPSCVLYSATTLWPVCILVCLITKTVHLAFFALKNKSYRHYLFVKYR